MHVATTGPAASKQECTDWLGRQTCHDDSDNAEDNNHTTTAMTLGRYQATYLIVPRYLLVGSRPALALAPNLTARSLDLILTAPTAFYLPPASLVLSCLKVYLTCA